MTDTQPGTKPLEWTLSDRLLFLHRWLAEQGETAYAAQIDEARVRLKQLEGDREKLLQENEELRAAIKKHREA